MHIMMSCGTNLCIFCVPLKVAPLRKITIPRLELWAALLATELREFIKRSCGLEAAPTFFYTDSTIAIYWIRKGAETSKPYVANRASAIRAQSDGIIWRHVEGDQNPADLLTRGYTVSKLKSSSLWFHGPDWLRLPQGLCSCVAIRKRHCVCMYIKSFFANACIISHS